MSGQAVLRAGVIGLGWAGQRHMAAYDDVDGVELVGIAGKETSHLAELGDQYAVQHRCTDWEDLIAAADLDVVSVAAPTHLHAPIAISALNAGVHVLSEKPMAENAEAAASMAAAAKANDRVLDVSFNHRMRGDIQTLKKVIDSGALGKIYYAKTGWLRREGIPGLGSWFTQAATGGGGTLMDLGVHMLDIALFLLGEPEVEAASAATYAEFGPRGKGGFPWGVSTDAIAGAPAFDVEDLATAHLRLSGGASLLLESSWALWVPRDKRYVTLYGTAGSAELEWDDAPDNTYRTLSVFTEVEGVPTEMNLADTPDGGHRECIVQFLDKVKSGQWSEHRGDGPVTRAAVVDACYASAKAGREVAVQVQHGAHA